ncbi:non-ribosomal peptide synthetase [Burkholderia cepacia]|uniref:non-ribosomal peptide synthetase n=1 Tax=Burkholderia cepacia TaxID=292 RepID=UPI001C932195|nr:non-ribosomal peptide synthetase [Burkholderia cepacia]MBY4715764.1 amino acid adenylation domain-containing protein [Burkholderia cepacia]MBY4739172.1 amino acid adenylation domain-containing protein [Burkholderia cepacia]MBY4746266.1 amino acid adenylation domain-containing protein [Burkholderia cepacia]MBY4763485.1 amino acid adenylation domain-containing protein [Burkholderia cepacia]MBY4775290.1 amino acid adenylation domain-containing protein [Burkholderia cepacia]
MTSFPTALHHRIRELARIAPDAPAIAAPFQNDLRLSRGALDARASRLARQLRAAGVGAEVRVGVCVERSCELFVALLAVLKAGGVFVPLDPRHPAARLDWIVQDARLRHGIVDAAGRAALGTPFEHAFDAAAEAADGQEVAEDDEAATAHPRAAAYMIYTSGSTGTPKAVVVEHGPLAAHCDALAAALPIEAGDRLLHFASVNFDAAHECWLAPLATGASIVVAPPQPFAPDAAHALMVSEAVNVAAFPPAYLREFAAVAARDGVPPALRVLAFGGEALPQQAFEFVRRTFPSVRLINGYGPTEAVISPMLWPVEPGETPALAADDAYASLPIGRVIGPRVARVDGGEGGEGDGVGELLLGGVCVARGYHGRPALTAERFVPDADGEPGARVYRTGDLARLRDDGAFDYLGRLDDQVQVRGVRVEPAEIAACLRSHPAVADAAVVAETGNGPTRLIACVALRAAADDAALKAHVAEQLPAAWQPHRFVRCDALPYTLNGKIDRAALREKIAAARDTTQGGGDAPRTPTEQQLAGLWQTLLGLDVAPSRDDRFFALGADSLAAMQLQAAIRAAVRVNLRLDTLFADPALAELAEAVDRAERETGEPLAAIAARRLTTDAADAAAACAPYVDRAASLAQQRFWVLAQTRDASAAYHIAAHWTIDGTLDRDALQRALDHVIGRHEAWRTTLVDNDDGVVMQRIHAHLPVSIADVDLRDQPPAARDAQAARLAEREAAEPFDLARGPLLRATLVALAGDRHRLLLTAHHAVIDGWSSRCAFDELSAAYRAYAEGRAPSLPDLPIQYADYADWQRDMLAGGEGERQLDYWRGALRDVPGPLALPVDRQPGAARTLQGARVSVRLPDAVAADVRQLARDAQATVFTVLLAALDAWLSRLTGATDVVVAVPVAHRQRPETRALLGLFLNTVALRVRVAPTLPFRALVDAARTAALDAVAHQDVPFERVVDAVKPPVKRGDEWLRVKFAQQFDARHDSVLPGATAVATPGPDLAARFDYAVDFTDDANGIELVAAYATDCIDADTARAWLHSYAALVGAAARDPHQTTAVLPCDASAAARQPRDGRALRVEHADIVAAFARQAAAYPHRVALADASASLTFGELDDASNRLARALSGRGVGAEAPVVVCIERSARFVVGLLGALKAGALAVLLDPAQPAARLAAAAADCGARWALVADTAAWPAGIDAQPLDVDTLAQDATLALAAGVRVAPHPEQGAYLIYTSGSTGTPKGVVVSHGALADYVQGMLDELAFAPDASFAMVSTVAADLGHTTLFGALCAGRTLHLLPAACAFDPDLFADEMRRRDVGVLKIVPSHLQALLDARVPADVLPRDALVTGGETLTWALVARLAALAPACRVINHYGPTEATVGAIACDTASIAADARDPASGVPLGLPLPNARALVLDAFGACVPAGATGELYLGGPGVARGYLGRPAQTAERFVPDPFTPGARLYRTGDRVRLCADGRLAFLGRIDDQVKIRGYRVEPGEVSAAVRAAGPVAQAETLAIEHDGRLRLATFVVMRDGETFDEAAVRAALAAKLPDYMVPAQFVALARLPVTANGKIDRAALREQAAAPVATASGNAPQGAVETVLADIWQAVLKAPQVGRDDNFFELGGDSILVLQVIARARKRGVRFTPKQLFDGPTVAELARIAKTEDVAVAAAAVAQPAAGSAAGAPVTAQVLTPAQQRFFALDIPRPGHWNQSVAFDVRGPFDADAFARAFDALLTHHDAFRQRFARGADGTWHASDAAKPYDALPFVEVAARDEADALARFDALQRRLDLGRGPLACACAARLPDGSTQLYLAIHHAIVDGVSWRILLDDLDSAYRAACERTPIRLSQPGLRADAWASRLARAATEPASPFAAEATYWAGMAQGDDVVPDHPDATATNADAAVVVQTIDAALTRAALTDAHAAYRTQTIELLGAALALALAGASGAASCRVELEGHGREALFDDADASRTIGWLTSHYPVTLPVAATARDTLCAVKDTLRAVPHKGLGFGVLAHYGDAATRAVLAAVPRPRVTFNYLGQFDAPRDAVLVPRFGGTGVERDPQGPLGNALAIHAYLDTDRDGARTLKVHWVYGAPQFERTTIDACAERFAAALRELVDACASRVAHRGAGATPGDFPLAQAAGLTQAAIERTPLDWRTIDDVYPLSPMQQGILFHALFAPGHASYVNQLVATAAALDADRLVAAFEASVARHDILRTSVMPDEAAPLQCVHRHARMPVEQLDWRTRGNTLDADFDAWLAADRARGFDWREPPLMRITLIRVTDDAWRVVWTRHHVLLDGWSTARLLADVLRDYRDPDAVSPFASRPALRYRDFIAWLGTRDRDADERFWTERLARLDAPTLIADRTADRADADMVTWRATLDADAMTRVAQTARALKLTVNTLVQGAWALALQRMTHQPAVAFGATVAGRPDALADVDSVLGLFINTVPVITAPAPQQRAADWLQALQRDNAAAAEHAHTPLADIQRWARGAGGALFDTLVVFENYPVDDTARDADPRALVLSGVRSIEATDFALTLVIESGAELTIDYGYDTARVDARQVETWHRAFACALDALARTPDALLGTLSIADDATRDALARAQDTAHTWPASQRQPLHLQFADAARATPDAIALEYADVHGGVHRATYRELDVGTSRIAAALRRRGVRPDTPVALCVERSFDMVMALVGVLKAGAAYLPVDPDYPAERIAYLLRDARPAVAITQAHLREQVEAALGDGATTQLLTVADLLADESVDETVDDNAGVTAEVDDAQLAYLIYTSGSTGKPKGAGNTHGALANRIAWMQHAYRLTRDDVVLHKTPFGFDVSVWEFVWPLAIGAKLAIAAPGDHRDPARLAAAIHAHGVTVLHFVPSMLAAFAAHLDDFAAAAQCDSVRLIVASGEALAPELVEKMARLLPHATLVNLYGPTEAAIDVSHWTCGPDDAQAVAVPIGHPIANLQLHVLDAAWQPVPAGATGELYLAGAGLARGYLGRPALTAERFVPDPFVPGARMYRTGDLARRRADGALDYLGRVDTQVKLRGQRIEPGEIEALLRAAPGVNDAVVIVRDEQLVGYVARGDAAPLDRAALLDTLRAQLPAYMVPSQLVELDALPVTPNGKCDRHALPAPVRETAAEAALATDTERALAGIWQRVLHVDAIGRDGDFFLLGGHSLLATQAHAQANLHWGLALPLRTLFDTRTLARCAEAIDAACAARGATDAASAIDALLGELETQ